MKPFNIFFAFVIPLALCFPLQSVAQCTASNASAFFACLTSVSDNIEVTGSFTIGGNVNLSGDVINLGSGGNRTLIFSGIVTVSSTTQFLGNGNVTLTNGISASPAGGQGVITFDELNTRLATGNYATLSDALNGILPVELSDFKATPRTSGIELLWSTSSELNNERFLIERSGADAVFVSIGEVKGAGTTADPKEYSFTDRAPLNGVNYYRLRQEDYDGKFEYSPVIAVQGPKSLTEAMKISPNPVYGRQIRVELTGQTAPLRLELIDAAGRRIPLVFGMMEQAADVALPDNLTAGVYYLSAVFAEEVLTVPLVMK